MGGKERDTDCHWEDWCCSAASFQEETPKESDYYQSELGLPSQTLRSMLCQDGKMWILLAKTLLGSKKQS